MYFNSLAYALSNTKTINADFYCFMAYQMIQIKPSEVIDMWWNTVPNCLSDIRNWTYCYGILEYNRWLLIWCKFLPKSSNRIVLSKWEIDENWFAHGISVCTHYMVWNNSCKHKHELQRLHVCWYKTSN